MPAQTRSPAAALRLECGESEIDAGFAGLSPGCQPVCPAPRGAASHRGSQSISRLPRSTTPAPLQGNSGLDPSDPDRARCTRAGALETLHPVVGSGDRSRCQSARSRSSARAGSAPRSRFPLQPSLQPGHRSHQPRTEQSSNIGRAHFGHGSLPRTSSILRWRFPPSTSVIPASAASAAATSMKPREAEGRAHPEPLSAFPFVAPHKRSGTAPAKPRGLF
jgi:hypothetical protein